MDKQKKYYQPNLPDEDWGVKLYSFEVYSSKKRCQEDFPGIEILEYSGDAIEDPTFVDGYGDIIQYKGRTYPLRVFEVKFEGDSKKDHPHTITAAPEYLLRDMFKNVGYNFNDKGSEAAYDEFEGKEEGRIDQLIYYYVEDEYFNLPAEKVCMEHIDEISKFIKEL